MFILDRPNSDKPTFIFLKKKLFDGPFKSSLGVKILPAFWNKRSERAIVDGLDRTTINEHKGINALLSNIENFITARATDARYNQRHLTCLELEEKIIDLTGRAKPAAPKQATFYDHCRAIIADMKSGVLLTPRGKRYSPGTVKNYNQSLNSIEEYNAGLTFNGITMEFYRSFIKWCNDKDWSMNYIAQHVKNLIGLMNRALERGHHNNLAYKGDDFKVIQEQTDDVSLTPDELDRIYQKHFPNKTLDLCRDWAIIDAYLGLRVSDMQLLDARNIENNKVTIANEKTDTKVVIPLRPEIRAILKKWKGLPPHICDQEFNRSIKEVCELCKIDETVLYFLTKGGARRDFYLKKYEMVSWHTFRRCFITNLLNAGIPDNQVMQLAGIKKHATLLRYKKTKPEETAEILKEHAYFK
jgi:integrase